MVSRIAAGQLLRIVVAATMWGMASPAFAESKVFAPRDARQGYPYVEWQIDGVPAPDAINPFDLVAWARFTHADSGESIRTGIFPDGDGIWKFRFAGTRLGRWTFETTCHDLSALDGLRGAVNVAANRDPVLARGLVTSKANQWTWSGSGRAFVPQLVMGPSVDLYHREPSRVEADLHRWYERHGFNGIHTALAMRWFDIDRERRSTEDGSSVAANRRPLKSDPNPDPRTFEALERLITASYERGGMVHLWLWGDESRQMTPVGLAGGINKKTDLRLQRYIAARLGPLPGWTVGYGFDLWEWVEVEPLLAWHAHMHAQLGWPHLLGGRMHRHGTGLEDLLTDRLDYIGFETHQPDVQTYRRALKLHPSKPVFMEDRFRVREPSPYPDKDYTPEMVRRGLWQSMMAGGVANIWGYMPRATGESLTGPDFANNVRIPTAHRRFF